MIFVCIICLYVKKKHLFNLKWSSPAELCSDRLNLEHMTTLVQ
jgi:hypothetical protein